MIRTSVSSSNLRSVGYDVATHTLEITFHSGGVYVYDSVPTEVHAGLMSAPSHGRYFDRHIKGRYAFRKGRA